MVNRIELMHAALNLVDEGIALLAPDSTVVLWNEAAEELTGHAAIGLLSRPLPSDLYLVDQQHRQRAREAAEDRDQDPEDGLAMRFGWTATVHTDSASSIDLVTSADAEQPTLVAMRHRLGHIVPAMLRRMPLEDANRNLLGTALLFHAVEDRKTLPHGVPGEGVMVERSQADMEDRLDAAHRQWATHQTPLGLLWVTVDQAAGLRRTHGRDACESMLRIVSQSLQRGLNPGELLGRWGNDEFLAISNERTPALLHEHAQRIAGLARTAEFHWWGDRLPVTVSIGAAHAAPSETLESLLHRARQAMQSSIYAGGNHVTASRELTCFQS